MNVIKKIFSHIPHLGSLKYLVALAVGVAIIGFGGGSSLLAHYGYKNRISELQSEIDHYDGEYRRDQAQIRQLQTDPKSMERIAREHYFMKTDDEDIFVLSDDDRKPESRSADNETVE